MRLHDLRPADGSRTPRTRVGRGIAAGQGKTAGRGTKGQKARAGGSIAPWFEGGQTPLHMRIPKLRGFKNRFKTEYEVVNVGAIAAAVERGAFEAPTGAKSAKGKAAAAQLTINQDLLRAVGLVRTLDKPLKVLGAGELTAPLFVVADAFSASARSKIEAAGGSVNVLEIPTVARPALGVETDAESGSAESTETGSTEAKRPAKRTARAARATDDDDEGESATSAESVDAPEASSASQPEPETSSIAEGEPTEAETSPGDDS